jgi:hypothetical protein
MKCTLLLILGLAGFLTGAGQSTDTVTNARPHGNNAFTPDTIPWSAAPPVVRAGAQFAVLEGTPPRPAAITPYAAKCQTASASRRIGTLFPAVEVKKLNALIRLLATRLDTSKENKNGS